MGKIAREPVRSPATSSSEKNRQRIFHQRSVLSLVQKVRVSLRNKLISLFLSSYIIKFFLLHRRAGCLHTITDMTARRDDDGEDRLESRSPPQEAGRYDDVSDRAMAITRIHRGSLMSVCQAVCRVTRLRLSPRAETRPAWIIRGCDGFLKVDSRTRPFPRENLPRRGESRFRTNDFLRR